MFLVVVSYAQMYIYKEHPCAPWIRISIIIFYRGL